MTRTRFPASGSAKGVWNDVAGDGGPGQQNPLPARLTRKALRKTFGDIGLWNERDREACRTRRSGRGFSNRGNVELSRRSETHAERCCTLGKRTDRVGAGEDEPIVGIECAQCLIEGAKILRRANLDDRDLNRLGAEFAQSITELAGLVLGARDEDALSGKRQREGRLE